MSNVLSDRLFFYGTARDHLDVFRRFEDAVRVKYILDEYYNRPCYKRYGSCQEIPRFGFARDEDSVGNPQYIILKWWRVPSFEFFFAEGFSPRFEFSSRHAVRATVAGEYGDTFVLATDVYACSKTKESRTLFRTLRSVMKQQCIRLKEEPFRFVGREAAARSRDGTVRLGQFIRQPSDADVVLD